LTTEIAMIGHLSSGTNCTMWTAHYIIKKEAAPCISERFAWH